MRLSSSILLISAAVLTCNFSSGIPDAKRSTRNRSEAETDGADPVKRLLRTNDTADDESRTMQLPLATDLHVANAFIRKEGQILKTLKLAQMPSEIERSFEQVINLLSGRVPEALPEPVVYGGRANREGLKAKKGLGEKRQARDAAITFSEKDRKQLEKAESKKPTQPAAEADVGKWLKEGLEADAVLARLRENKDGFNILRESDLLALQQFLMKSKKGTDTKPKDLLLQTLVRGYGDEAVVARLLSAAKMDDDKPSVACKVQAQLLQGWLDRGDTLDAVYKKVMVASDASPKNRVLAYTLADTMDIIIGFFNKGKPSGEQVDPFLYLLTSDEDKRVRNVALMVYQAKDMGQPYKKLRHQLLSWWMLYGKDDPIELATYCFQELGSKGAIYANLMEKDFAMFFEKNYHIKYMARPQGKSRAS